jgi:phage baseplate assembly protein W
MPIKEIYIKNPNDSTYQDNLLEHSDIYESILAKIRMILETRTGEVLGDANFGVNLEEYVFSLNASNETIKRKIKDQIYYYIPEALVVPIDVDVSFVKDKYNDVCIVDISIDGQKALRNLIY